MIINPIRAARRSLEIQTELKAMLTPEQATLRESLRQEDNKMSYVMLGWVLGVIGVVALIAVLTDLIRTLFGCL